MDKIWLLYGYYRYSPLRCLLKSWNYLPSDEDQNEVKRIGGFDGYELKEMELYNQGDEMNKLFLAPLLAATLLSAQTKTPKHSCPVEDIPHGAVQATSSHDGTPYCPREDYELKWFVQESETYYGWTNNGLWTGTSVVREPKPDRSYYFKPMCLPKDGANGAAN